MRQLGSGALSALILGGWIGTASGQVSVTSPTAGTIVQRSDGAETTVLLEGRARRVRLLRVAIVRADGRGGRLPPRWVVVGRNLDGAFRVGVGMPSGWWKIVVHDGRRRVTIGPVGVGEVFVVAGQSNAGNHGEVRLPPRDPRVRVEELGDGGGGNPWGVAGDRLAAGWGLPVRFIVVAVGGTSIDRWAPGGDLHGRIAEGARRAGPNGVRAVLWHQGESDVLAGTSGARYAERLRAAAWSGAWPWYVARASYVPVPGFEARGMEIAAAQGAVVDWDRIRSGPTTDDLIGVEWRFDGIHLNRRGLIEHGRRWADVLSVAIGSG